MERKFNLIKSDFEKHEKRVLPRFPFCYLTFKSDNSSRVYEVKDISHSGMQISLKENLEQFPDNSTIKGSIHWMGRHLEVAGTVKWSTQNRLGLEFLKRRENLEQISEFLDIKSIVKYLKPLHKLAAGMELPPRLKYWLRSDGPVEIFVWQHGDGELSKVQVLFFEIFVEWEDGMGLKTGRTLSKRNVDSPLLEEDEWVFKIDDSVDQEKLNRVHELLSILDQELLASDVKSFLLRHMS